MSDTTTIDVLCERIEALKQQIDERFNENKKDHEDIIKQTTATNGKVAELDKFKIQSRLALTIIGFVMSAIVIPLFLMYLKKQLGL